MRKLKKRWMRRFVFVMTTVLATGNILCGCSRQEMIRTISLPDTEDKDMGISGFVIKNIQEYTYEGQSEDHLQLAWGKAGENTVCQLRYEKEGYIYREIDIHTKKTIRKVFMDERMAFNMQIAPGGKFISYEAETEEKAGPELVVFLAEEGEHMVLREWDECLQGFSYVWSDDGNRLFSWQNGDNYAFQPDTDWCVTCYDMKTVKRDSDGKWMVEKTEFQMKGSNYAQRHILPNADGSRVYVREEYDSFSDSKNQEYPGKDEAAEEKMMRAKNWLLIPEEQKKKKVSEYSKETVWPVKYTKKGLYYQNEEGMLLLAENVEDKPSVKELFRASNMEIAICGNGDHIFHVEWIDDMQNMQISGVKLEGTQPTAKQVLYKDSCEGVEFYVSADDSAIVLRGYEYPGDDRCSFKIMKLGY